MPQAIVHDVPILHIPLYTQLGGRFQHEKREHNNMEFLTWPWLGLLERAFELVQMDPVLFDPITVQSTYLTD